MEYKFKIYQKQGLSFMILFDNNFNYEDYYLSIILKYPDDKDSDNLKVPVTPIFKKMDSTNFSNEELALIRNGDIPINISHDMTNIDATEYILQVKITDENNTSNFFTLQADLEILFDYEKR